MPADRTHNDLQSVAQPQNESLLRYDNGRAGCKTGGGHSGKTVCLLGTPDANGSFWKLCTHESDKASSGTDVIEMSMRIDDVNIGRRGAIKHKLRGIRGAGATAVGFRRGGGVDEIEHDETRAGAQNEGEVEAIEVFENARADGGDSEGTGRDGSSESPGRNWKKIGAGLARLKGRETLSNGRARSVPLCCESKGC